MSVEALAPHPVPACVQRIEQALDALSPEAWAGLEPQEVRSLTARLSRAQSRITAHTMAAARVLEEAGTARHCGATSTGDLLSRDFGGDRGAGDALVRTARRIQEQTTHTQQSLAEGRISTRQADVISRGLAALPGSATAEQRDLAERTLLKDAEKLSVKDLRRRTDRLTDVYRENTDDVDADEDALLRAREHRARARTRFSLWDNHDGTHSGRFVIGEAAATMLKTALDALAAPHQQVGHDDAQGRHTETGFGESYPQRLGHAFTTLVGLLPADQLPSNGGVSAVVTVNLDYETLMGGLKAAQLSDGTRVSAGEARRMACTAGILPMVLGGTSLPLDLGTPTRYFNRSSRRAMEKRDGGCTAPGCDRDSRWCEAHHLTPHSVSGVTDITDGALLCTFHHHRVHEQHWSGRVNPDDGHIEWKPPGHRIWQRNHRWRP
ncbi:DUF222 domain-containing protein [Aeromicrobium sp. CTD01-1L150]|uniref:HNH endonuclease signature motif containing protein n=1 Tax=Aeromicrobium sp. CTD01-1L150 TaxID=3341830 RepID=UPI0035C244A9